MTARRLLDELTGQPVDEAEAVTGPAAVRRAHGQRSIVEIPVEAILLESPLQTRQVSFDPAQFAEDAELLESVRQYGVIEPVLVQMQAAQPGEKARYRLVFGSRRTQAARLAGRETVPALVAQSHEPVDALTIAENTGRRELSPYEKARVLIQLKKQTPEIVVGELAQITGWSQPTVYALLSAYEKSPPVLRRIFAAGQAAPRTIQEMQAVFTAAPEEQHEQLAQLLAGRTHAEITQLRNAVQLGRDPLVEARRFTQGEDLGTAEPNAPSSQPIVQLPPAHTAPEITDRKDATLPAAPETQHNVLIGDDAMLRSLVEITSVERAAAERLLQQAVSSSLPYPTLCIACLYVAKGGAEGQALEMARLAFRHRKAVGALRRQIDYVQALSATRAWVSDLPGKELKSFFLTLFKV